MAKYTTSDGKVFTGDGTTFNEWIAQRDAREHQNYINGAGSRAIAERAAAEKEAEAAQKAIDMECAQYRYSRDDMYNKGEAAWNRKDFIKAAIWYQKAAERGHAEAQKNLGYCYNNGKGVTEDWTKAAEWYCKAAEQGNVKAQCNLGRCYIQGAGVTKDYTKAVEWFRKAAAQGSVEAKDALEYHASQIAAAEGTQSPQKASAPTLQKADPQKAVALLNEGLRYWNGDGIPKDIAKAIELFRKSADMGNATAQWRLGNGYSLGLGGFPENQTKAVEWYQKAADQGLAVAQNLLGICYQNGIAVAVDYANAAKWYRKAAEQGDAGAQKSLDELKAEGKI